MIDKRQQILLYSMGYRIQVANLAPPDERARSVIRLGFIPYGEPLKDVTIRPYFNEAEVWQFCWDHYQDSLTHDETHSDSH